MDYWPEDYLELFRHRDRGLCNERALVLRARGIDCRTVYQDGVFLLLVEPGRALESAEELAQYELEDHAPAPRLQPLPSIGIGFAGVTAYIACLLLVGILDNQHALASDWLRQGILSTGLVRQGEWWRVITALTLHMDIAHLLGNIMVGAVFGYFLGKLLGDGLAWFAILMSGALGNALSVLLQDPTHSAAGASTAVFGALGILSAYTWRLRRGLAHLWALRIGPLVAGVTLLAWLGTGDEKTDIVAHLTGFLAGGVIGVLLAAGGNPPRLGITGQWALAAASLGLVFGAWVLALKL
jgi:membrane associated rhomboid family serine protease